RGMLPSAPRVALRTLPHPPATTLLWYPRPALPPSTTADLRCPAGAVQGAPGQGRSDHAKACESPTEPSVAGLRWARSRDRRRTDPGVPRTAYRAMTTGAAPSHDHEPTPGPIDPPPGFTTCATPTLPVIVPEAFGDWDATQRAGYLARRHANAAEALTMGFAYTCLTTAGESDTERDPWHTAAAMIGAALGSSRHVAHRLITTAIELTERLPRTCA